MRNVHFNSNQNNKVLNNKNDQFKMTFYKLILYIINSNFRKIIALCPLQGNAKYNL